MFQAFREVKGDFFKVMGAVFLAFFVYYFSTAILGDEGFGYWVSTALLALLLLLGVEFSLASFNRSRKSVKSFADYFKRAFSLSFSSLLFGPFVAVLFGEPSGKTLALFLGLYSKPCMLDTYKFYLVTDWFSGYFLGFLAVSLLVAWAMWAFLPNESEKEEPKKVKKTKRKR